MYVNNLYWGIKNLFEFHLLSSLLFNKHFADHIIGKMQNTFQYINKTLFIKCIHLYSNKPKLIFNLNNTKSKRMNINLQEIILMLVLLSLLIIYIRYLLKFPADFKISYKRFPSDKKQAIV